ncbi:major facilitator superfamily domain-containing protein [Clohesyomyces aquaticus]|uniref:Major facilitator superfamily domain-containing protein n=1 Tax=Clohesyomyces aquaticus TaxID=1231657 RepID=A0A1Y1ZT87_9PLEO|nr:major facilitator superfamily domain-containing protein [Clohesyomyces aquaticus]
MRFMQPTDPSANGRSTETETSTTDNTDLGDLLDEEKKDGTTTPRSRNATPVLNKGESDLASHKKSTTNAEPRALSRDGSHTNSTEHGINDKIERDVVQHTDAEKVKGEEAEEPTNEDNDSKYLTGYKLGILSLGLCLTTFVIALDNTIIATAIPKITTVFNSLDDVGWYGSSYLLTTCSLQPSFGRIYTFFDVKYTYLFALVLFEVGSIICAAATSSPMFIIGRAVAGAGAAALFSGGMTIIGYSVRLSRRPIYIAALSSMFGIASVVGPILGGALTDKVSWRWCFWINLPFGAVSLVVVFFFFANPERMYSHVPTRQRIKEIDLLGALFLICSIVSLLLALQWGGQTYPWKNSRIWGCLLGFGLMIAVFIGIQIHSGERATIPLRVIKQRTILISCLFSALLSMSLYTHIFYLPFYFQASKGTTAEESGIRTIAYLVSITVSSIVIGGAITVIGYYAPFMWFGAAIFTIGAGLIYTLKLNSPAGIWIGYQILAGIGAGASVQIPFIAVQVVASEKDMPTANACVMFFNSLGGAIAISIAQNIFVNSLSSEILKRAPGVDPRIVIGAGATHVRQVVPKEMLTRVLEAYTKAIDNAFTLAIATAGIAVFVSFFMEMRSVKGKKLLPGGAA